MENEEHTYHSIVPFAGTNECLNFSNHYSTDFAMENVDRDGGRWRNMKNKSTFNGGR